MDYRQSIQRSIDAIEARLGEEISVEQLAAAEGFSPFHFYRVFQAYAGMPVMSYVRARRLAHAAAEIARGGRILEAALNWGFDTHAGFTRAFRRAYGMPPEQYRIHGCARVPSPIDLFTMRNYNLTGGIVMEPKFVERPAFKVAGYELRTTARDGENLKTIPAFWQDYMKNRIRELHGSFTPVSHSEYGLCLAPEDPQSGEFSYVIGLEVKDFADVPDAFCKKEVPASTYVVFTTPPSDGEGFVGSIQNTWAYVYGEWFPQSGYAYAQGCADFEIYDERCMSETGKQAEIWIPVVRNEQ